jgi:hypothetical protein
MDVTVPRVLGRHACAVFPGANDIASPSSGSSQSDWRCTLKMLLKAPVALLTCRQVPLQNRRCIGPSKGRNRFWQFPARPLLLQFCFFSVRITLSAGLAERVRYFSLKELLSTKGLAVTSSIVLVRNKHQSENMSNLNYRHMKTRALGHTIVISERKISLRVERCTRVMSLSSYMLRTVS